MAMNYSRFQSIFKGMTTAAQKVYSAVPRSQADRNQTSKHPQQNRTWYLCRLEQRHRVPTTPKELLRRHESEGMKNTSPHTPTPSHKEMQQII